jgi:galactokinase
MVQYAVTLKDGDWTLFKDGEPTTSGLSRSAAIEVAKALAFEAEERGETVELLIQGYYGDLSRKLTGGSSEG